MCMQTSLKIDLLTMEKRTDKKESKRLLKATEPLKDEVENSTSISISARNVRLREKNEGLLIHANKELRFQNEEKEKRVHALLSANAELLFQNGEKGKRVLELESVNKGILSSLTANIAVIDKNGIIIQVNKAWDDFAKANGATSLACTSTGSNYFGVCKKSFAEGDALAGTILDGIRSVSKKEKQIFEIEYPCHSPVEQRWFVLHVMRFVSDDSKVVISHQNITKIKQSQIALQNTQSDLNAIFENTSEGFILTDLKGMVKTFNNKSKEMIFQNLEREIKTGEPIFDFIHPSRAGDYADSISKVIAGQRLEYDFPYPQKNSETKWLNFSIGPVYNSGKIEGLCITSSDITERKLAEQRMQRSETNLKAIIENTDALIYSVDNELKYITFNKQLQLSLKEAYGIEIEPGDDVYSFLEKLDPLQAKDWKEIYSRALGGEAVKFEREFHLNNTFSYISFSIHPIWENGQVVGLSCFTVDITKQKEADRAIRNSELDILKAYKEKDIILESIDDAFFAVDKNWMVTYWNKKAEKILMKLKYEVIGKNLWTVFGDSTDSTSYKKYHEAVRSQRALVFEDHYPLLNKWYEISAYPSATGLSVYSKDITKSKVLELERAELLSDMVQRNKVLEQFSYIISHNLRAPIAHILGLCGLLESNKSEPEERLKIEKYLFTATQQLDTIIRDLNVIIQVTHNVDEKKEGVVFSTMVDRIKSSIQNIMEKEKVQIITRFSAAARIFTLNSYLYSIFYNLISNAIKYARPKKSPLIMITSEKRKGKVILQFKDNGRGIDLEKHGDKIFGLYKRFHLEVEGKGMGLYMVKSQVEALGGKITVKSVVDKGTTFRIEFPD